MKATPPMASNCGSSEPSGSLALTETKIASPESPSPPSPSIHSRKRRERDGPRSYRASAAKPETDSSADQDAVARRGSRALRSRRSRNHEIANSVTPTGPRANRRLRPSLQPEAST